MPLVPIIVILLEFATGCRINDNRRQCRGGDLRLWKVAFVVFFASTLGYRNWVPNI